MIHERVNAGDRLLSVLDQTMLNDITTVVNAYFRGELGGQAGATSYGGTAMLVNKSGQKIEAGELVATKAAYTFKAGNIDAMTRRPPIELESVAWHTNLTRAMPVPKTLKADATLAYQFPTWQTVKIKPGTVGSGDFLMVDPDTPTQMICCSAGIAKVISRNAANNLAVADFRFQQPLWRYELNAPSQAPGGTDAKLIDPEGAQIAASFTLSDPESLMSNQGLGATGWCIQRGNDFEAIQARC